MYSSVGGEGLGSPGRTWAESDASTSTPHLTLRDGTVCFSLWQVMLDGNLDLVLSSLFRGLSSWDPRLGNGTTSTNHDDKQTPTNIAIDRALLEDRNGLQCLHDADPVEYALGVMIRGLDDECSFTSPQVTVHGEDGIPCLPVALGKLTGCPPLVSSRANAFNGEVTFTSSISNSSRQIAYTLCDRLSATTCNESPSDIDNKSTFLELLRYAKWVAGVDGEHCSSIALQMFWVCARITYCSRLHDSCQSLSEEVLHALLHICLSQQIPQPQATNQGHSSTHGTTPSSTVDLFMELISIQWFADTLLGSSRLMGLLASSTLEGHLEEAQQIELEKHKVPGDACDPLHTASHINRVTIGATLCVAASAFGLPTGGNGATPQQIHGHMVGCINALVLAPIEMRLRQLTMLSTQHHHHQQEPFYEALGNGWRQQEQLMLAKCFQSLFDLIADTLDDDREERGQHRIFNGALTDYFWGRCRNILFSNHWLMWRYCVVEIGSWPLLEHILGITAEFSQIVEEEMTADLFGHIFPLSLQSVRCRDALFHLLHRCPSILYRNWDVFLLEVPDLLRTRDAFTRRNVLELILAVASHPTESERLTELGEILDEYDFQVGKTVTIRERELLRQIMDVASASQLYNDDNAHMSPLSDSGFHFELGM